MASCQGCGSRRESLFPVCWVRKEACVCAVLILMLIRMKISECSRFASESFGRRERARPRCPTPRCRFLPPTISTSLHALITSRPSSTWSTGVPRRVLWNHSTWNCGIPAP